MEPNNNINKLNQICNMLPDFCRSYLRETGTQMALTTRIAYGREIQNFLEYLISYHPVFCESKCIDITVDQLKIVTSQDISRYLTHYKDAGNKERTIARKRAALSGFYTYLINNKILQFNPVLAAVKVSIHQSDDVIHLNMDEQDTLLNAVEYGTGLNNRKLLYHKKYKKRDIAIFSLLLDTGLRVSELQGINIYDIDFDNCFVSVVRKGGNIQKVYFSDEVRDILLDYYQERMITDQTLEITDPFFVTLKGDRMTISTIQKLVKKYTTTALPGIGSKLSPHKMRSSFAMAYYEETKDILALQRKLGHKSLQATNIYAKATDKKMSETRNVLSHKRHNVQK